MKDVEPKTLFTALAFLAVVQKGEDAGDPSAAKDIRRLAGLIETFCAESAVRRSTLSSETSETPEAAVIDQVIARHIQDLQDKQETRLPENRESLIGLCDRLQQRKARRMQRDFYATATEAKLADLALEYLDEEIEDGKALT